MPIDPKNVHHDSTNKKIAISYFVYGGVSDLPEAVRNALPEEAQKIWMAAFNSTMKNGGDEEKSSKIAWSVVKKNGFSKDADGNWTKLSEFYALNELSEDVAGKPIQVLKVGTYKHPEYGEIAVNDSLINELKQNFDDKVRRIEASVDIDHNHSDGAVGWVKELINKGKDGLWAVVDWTKKGAELVKDGAFRYTSAHFGPYTDAESGTEYSNVLMSVAITNFPFIKGMAPIELSEKGFVYEEIKNNLEGQEAQNSELGGEYMDMKAMAEHVSAMMELLGKDPPDMDAMRTHMGAMAEMVNAAMQGDETEEGKETLTEPKKGGKSMSEKKEPTEKKEEKEETKLTDPNVVIQLAELVTQVKQLQETRTKDRATIDLLEAQNTLLTTQDEVNKLSDLGNGKQLSPAVRQLIVDAIVKKDNSGEAIKNMVKALTDKDAVVELGERGTSVSDDGAEVQDKLHARAVDIQKEKSLSYPEALNRAAVEMKEVVQELYGVPKGR